MVKATWNGHVIAKSDRTVVVEGDHHFPPEDVDRSALKESDHQTTCPWKGQASYHHIEVDGQINEDAAWCYPNPKPKASGIKDHIAFWKGIEVTG